MLLIAGLGNPGRRYANNRHNIGFMAADEVHRRHHFSPWRARFQGEISEGMLGGEKTLLLKPATFMNESGRSVGEAMRFFKLSPADVVVMYDELDLPPGKVRMRTGGGRPTHNGIRSITAHIGADFRRMRIGIGHPGHKSLVNAHVLKDFSKAERDWVRAVTDAIAEHVGALVSEGDSAFMNKVHLRLVESGLFDGDGEETASDAPPRGARAKAAAADRGATPGDRGDTDPPQDRSRSGALADGLRRLFGRTGD